MKNYLKYTTALLLFIAFASADFAQTMPDTLTGDGIIVKGATPQLVSSQFSFTEGPAVDKHGNIFFTDQPNNKIWEYSADGKLSLFLDSAGRSNGTYFDRKGNLIACADEHNQLWSISPKGKITVLINLYKGKHLNGPNDLWLDHKGGIYITDPYYQRPYWARKAPEIDGEKVYYLPKGQHELIVVADDLVKPNGIVGSPDGKTLYIADIRDNKIYKYHMMPDGKLSDKTLFVNQGADGITLDNRGNVYLCGNGVTVYNPQGQKILHIPIPERWTANICFGGKDKSTLFMTASKSVYILPTRVKGVE